MISAEDWKKFIYETCSGTTCPKHTVQKIVGEYVVIKHWSHASYCDRVSGVNTCQVSYKLVKYSPEVDYRKKFVFGGLFEVEGKRWSKAVEKLFDDKIKELQDYELWMSSND